MIGTFRKVVANEGAGALLTGVGPTFAGYFLQGAFKFGGYEFFKQQCISQLGYETASNNRTAVYLASAAAAEFFADIALCPLEATRIRLVSEPTFASGLVSGFGKIAKQEGFGAFYSGFGPILFKQVPYTMAKFVVYEKAAELIWKSLDKNTASDGIKTAVNLGAGLTAGFAAAIVSQPADTMLSKINKTKGLPGEGTTSRLIKIAKELGLRGSFGGLGARLFMVGTLTAGQFAIYGYVVLSGSHLKRYADQAPGTSRGYWGRRAVSRSPNDHALEVLPCSWWSKKPYGPGTWFLTMAF
jgi:solute carrier family 25 (mitochondrial phosphate transporter), member 3